MFPGWVLVTLMTAGLVAALWAVAEGQLDGAVQRRARQRPPLTRAPLSGRRRRETGSAVADFVLVAALVVRAVRGPPPGRV